MSAALHAWLQAARLRAQQPPAQPRLPLWVAGQVVGSVAHGVLSQISLQRLLDKRYQLSKTEQSGVTGWHLDVPPEAATDALNTLAAALRDANLCGPWRNEQLAVCNAEGERVATVERGAVRALGITTVAVHLVGLAPDGRMWVQKRALTKPNDPGLWDTLMGGMIAATDSLEQALARETWEEAGLHVADLHHVTHGGHVLFSRPSSEAGGTGYMVERIDWFIATVPEGLAPSNQDGEVDEFALRSDSELHAQVAEDRFTLEAALVMAGYWGV
ncbi:NUDIX hydrolase [Paracidovorax sp. MALMAid1276]|uniref:NUDIX hydrolase n=1 Tax=Paracidovorax sp. MALMAid1276 TaxID=3411631 RepID=UPI003B9A6FB6